MDSNYIALFAALAALFSAIAAFAAVIGQRRNTKDMINAQIDIGARHSRAVVVSANRQNWIDQLRNDISDFIAARSALENLRSAGSFEKSGIDSISAEERKLQKELLMLHARVQLRLNLDKEDHRSLLIYIDEHNKSFTNKSDNNLRKQSSVIFKSTWERIKKEASEVH